MYYRPYTGSYSNKYSKSNTYGSFQAFASFCQTGIMPRLFRWFLQEKTDVTLSRLFLYTKSIINNNFKGVAFFIKKLINIVNKIKYFFF